MRVLDSLTSLFQFNGRGEVEYTALDINANGLIDFAGTDRITRTATDVLTNATLAANVTRTRVYAWSTPSSAVSNLLSSTDASVDGLHTWQTAYRDASTTVTNRTDSLYAGNGYRYVTNTAPDGSFSVSQFQYGRLVSAIRKDSLGSQLSGLTYAYDAHGRQWQVIDARNGATTYSYNDADLVTSVTTPQPGNGQNAQTTLTYYNNRLQVSAVSAPDGATTTYEYYPSGELKRTYGARTYPVGYSYDYAGRVKTMTNWTTFASGAGARVTTWNYDLYRGWLTNKTYAGGATGPDYTYTPGGRLLTRTWARIGTQSKRIVTTYTYGFNDGSGSNEHADLLTIVYSRDPQNTPGVTYAYDRRGRTATVDRNSITTTLAFNDAGQLLSESHSGGTLGGLAVTNGYDGLLRRANLVLRQSSNPLIQQSFSYDSASRLQTVGDGTNTAAYTYLANSPLVRQIGFTNNGSWRMTTSKQYDFLNRLTKIETLNSQPSTLNSFTYWHNDANQRVKVTLADGSFWLYEYDSLGQVQSGKRYWSDWTPVAGQQFEYAHDDIGNRSSTKAGGDENGLGLRSATYAANSLNQYANRTVPGAVDIIGAANAAATVTVNNQSVYRRGEYYRKELAINNGYWPVWAGVTNRAVEAGTTNTVSGNLFLEPTPEVFTYDADGNLLTDGHWNYVWDAENRLLEMGVNTAVGPQRYLRLEYDWQGRRIGKKVWNNASGNGQPAITQKFVYDGWNLLGILNSSFSLQASFTWGLDLSGSLQGAGGVGGLLAINDATNGVHFATYDGNGNVSALVRASDGTVSANYEYGPFGEVIRATGPVAKANPLRFSTKYQDDETDLLCYGCRYYSPSTGRWLSRDPIEERGGLNLYEFVANSPLERVDKDGLTTYDFDKNTYYRAIDFQPGDTVIFPGGSSVVVQAGDQSAIAKYKCLLGKLGFDYSSPKFPIYWAAFNNAGTAWTLDYGILPSKRPTFFDRQRMDPPTTVSAELNSVTVWHEIKGHNVDGAADGAAFDAKYEAPVYAAIKQAKSVLECMWCEPKDGSRRYVVPNRFFRFMCECGINAPPARNK